MSGSKMTRPLTKSFFNRIQITSLNNLFLNQIILILQIYLIINRIKLLNNLTSTYSHTSSSLPILSNQQKLNNSIIINIFLITFSIIFALVHALIGSIKLGVYSHDGFKLGKNFDKNKSKLINLNDYTASTSTCSSSISSDNTVSISKQKLTKSNSQRPVLGCYFFKRPSFWAQLPPLGVLFHILSSFCILLAEVQLSSRRIQLGNKPVGDIFSSKSDFLFGEPINRLKMFKSSYDLSQIKSPIKLTTAMTDQKNYLNDVINSKDDFTLFGYGNQKLNFHSSLIFIVSENTIGLDCLNFVIALVTFSSKVCQTFWSSSKSFSFLLISFTSLMTIVLSNSYSAFEILLKSNNLKVIARNFLFFAHKNDKKQDTGINLVQDYGHDLVSALVYTISSLFLFINVFLFTTYGYRKFNFHKIKLQKNINKYIRKNYHEKEFLTDVHDKNCAEISIEKSDTISNCSPKSQSEQSNSSFNTSITNSNNFCDFKFIKSYKENILSSILLLFYCIIRSMFIYELIIVFKFTSDSLILAQICLEVSLIIVWIILLICLTFKENWNFKLDSNYKILFWNHIYSTSNLKQNISLNSERITNLGSNQDYKMNLSDKSLEERSKIGEGVRNSAETISKAPGLLVRDDSMLNRSSYLSSSSITEVSSLMPSTFAANQKMSAQYNSKMVGSKASIPSDMISSTIMSDRNIVLINDDDSSTDETSLKFQQYSIENELTNDDCQIYSQVKRNKIVEKNMDDDSKDRIKWSHKKNKNSLKKSLPACKSVIATIGEIMEEDKNKYLNPSKIFSASNLNKSLNIIDSASSSATIDSGRESITESPVNLNNPTTANEKSSKMTISNFTSGIYKAQTVQLKAQNQMLDSNC
ncbi:hypothetical protein BpHYR1_052124 [Brachionus plicatilis]|uniref:Uncharacterized protein n=1 Tax=Brachionus plicatilis TaxID=10195 RepID=A0A3M7RXT5_BRAPC|nr:hypothetical protein BpHYR1_052124 [Brachionus plicatilis]